MKRTKILVALALMSAMCFGAANTAFAEVDGFIIKDSKTQKMYMYDAQEVLKSFRRYSRWNEEDNVYKEFKKNVKENNLYMLYDDSGKFVRYKDAAKEFNKTRPREEAFDIDKYINNVKGEETPDYVYNRVFKDNQFINTINIVKDNGQIDFRNKKISEDILISAENVELKNVNIKGKLIIECKADAKIILKNIQCNEIEVLSGGNKGVKLDNVKVNKMRVACGTSIISAKSTKIKTTVIDVDKKQTVNLAGHYGRVELKKDSNIKIEKGAEVYIFADKNANNAVVDVAEETYVRYKGNFIIKGSGKDKVSKLPARNEDSSSHKASNKHHNSEDSDSSLSSSSSNNIDEDVVNTLKHETDKYVDVVTIGFDDQKVSKDITDNVTVIKSNCKRDTSINISYNVNSEFFTVKDGKVLFDKINDTNYEVKNNINIIFEKNGKTISKEITVVLKSKIAPNDLAEINKQGTYNNNYLITYISNSAIFGPSSGVSKIEGDIDIRIPDAKAGESITLRNIEIIGGNISIDFGNGDVIFDNVKVDGVIINNIGKNSLHIKGYTNIGVLNINDTDNDAHVVIESLDVEVNNTNLNSGAKLEVKNDVTSKNPFKHIKIAPSQDGQTIVLDGNFQSIEIERGARVVIAPNTQILGTLTIVSGAEVSLGDNAVVKKVDISTRNEYDKVILSGNFSNVEVNNKTDIQIKSGNANISSNVKVDVKVDSGASITPRGDVTNINTTGDGTLKENENKSSENILEDVLLDGVKIEYGVIKNVPAAITVNKLMKNLVLPAFSCVVVNDINDNVLSGEDYLLENSKLIVTAENGDKRIYMIGLDYYLSCPFSPRIKIDKFIDTNNIKGIVSGTLSFNIYNEHEDIQGYYVELKSNYVKDGQFQRETVWGKFFESSDETDNKYEICLTNIAFNNIKAARIYVTPVYNNKCSYSFSGHNNLVIDEPKSDLSISIEGVEVEQFTDTNNEKGRVAGTIVFTRASNENNIEYYDISIGKEFISGGGIKCRTRGLGSAIIPDGSEKYSIDIPEHITEDFDLRNAERILIIIKGYNQYMEKTERIIKTIYDSGDDGIINLSAPLLYLNNEELYSLKVTNFIQGADIKLYVYDLYENKYISKLDQNKNQVYVVSNYDIAEFFRLEPGNYKVTQYAKGKESDMSNEIIVKPAQLVVAIEGTRINFINALDGADIKLYDENKDNFIKNIKIVNEESNYMENIEPGNYVITQTVNGIESDEINIEIQDTSNFKEENPVEKTIQFLNTENEEIEDLSEEKDKSDSEDSRIDSKEGTIIQSDELVEEKEVEDDVRGSIFDSRNDGIIDLSAPSLSLNNEELCSLEVTDFIEGADIKLYVYDLFENEYTPKLDESKNQVYAVCNHDIVKFLRLEPGNYKVTQYTKGKESDMSNEIIIKPGKLEVVIEGSRINIINALEGADIKLYDENKDNIIKNVKILNEESNHMENIEPGNYIITQTVNGIEGDEINIEIQNIGNIKTEKPVEESLEPVNIEDEEIQDISDDKKESEDSEIDLKEDTVEQSDILMDKEETVQENETEDEDSEEVLSQEDKENNVENQSYDEIEDSVEESLESVNIEDEEIQDISDDKKESEDSEIDLKEDIIEQSDALMDKEETVQENETEDENSEEVSLQEDEVNDVKNQSYDEIEDSVEESLEPVNIEDEETEDISDDAKESEGLRIDSKEDIVDQSDVLMDKQETVQESDTMTQ
jgi:hypothetical protein